MPELRFRNKKIFYRIAGRGPVVFLVHGFGENGNVWDQQISALQEHSRVIIPDLPGSGESELLEGNMTLDDYAEVLNVIADKECPGELINLFGHSMGGYITMAFLEKYSHRLQSIGLIHSSSYADTPEKIETRKKAISFIRENGGAAFLKTVAPNMFSDESKSIHPEYVKKLFDLGISESDEALMQYYEAMIQRPDRSKVLAAASLPVLFTIGRYDNAIPFDLSMKQCHLPSISSVNILEGSGHMGMWEDSAKTISAMMVFLETFSR